MIAKDLTILVPWIIAHGYFIFLVIAIIEGPFVTIAGGIAAALGYFNIYIIIILAISGDLGGDVLWYGLGYKSQNIIKSKFFRYLGATDQRIIKMENLIHTNIRKAVIIAKLSPLIGPVGHIIIGTTRVSFKKFFETATAIAIPKSIFFALVGYFSVKVYLNINKTVSHTEYALLGIGIIIAVIYFLYTKATKRVAEKLEKSN